MDTSKSLTFKFIRLGEFDYFIEKLRGGWFFYSRYAPDHVRGRAKSAHIDLIGHLSGSEVLRDWLTA